MEGLAVVNVALKFVVVDGEKDAEGEFLLRFQLTVKVPGIAVICLNRREACAEALVEGVPEVGLANVVVGFGDVVCDA